MFKICIIKQSLKQYKEEEMRNEEKNKYFLFTAVALQMMLSLAVVPVFADEELTSAVYEEPESPAVTYNMNVDWKFKKAADGSEYPLAKASQASQRRKELLRCRL